MIVTGKVSAVSMRKIVIQNDHILIVYEKNSSEVLDPCSHNVKLLVRPAPATMNLMWIGCLEPGSYFVTVATV